MRQRGNAPSPNATTEPAGEEPAAPVRTEAGWNAWEQKEFLTANRKWQAVSDFFAALARGEAGLSALGLQEPHLFRLELPSSSLGGGAAATEAATASAYPAAQEERAATHSAVAGSQQAQPPLTLARIGAQGACLKMDGPANGTTGTTDTAASEPDGASHPAYGSAAGTRSGTRMGESASTITSGGCSSLRKGDAAAAGCRRGGGKASGIGRHGRGEQRSAVRERNTYKVTVSYWGGAFTGWAFQPGRVTVQATLETALQALVGADAPQVVVSAAGRTDAGVHGSGMPFSFYAWQTLQLADVARAVDAAAPGRLRTLSVEEQPRQFHAMFSATWRRYVYLFPLRDPQPSTPAGSDDHQHLLGALGCATSATTPASVPTTGAAPPSAPSSDTSAAGPAGAAPQPSCAAASVALAACVRAAASCPFRPPAAAAPDAAAADPTSPATIAPTATTTASSRAVARSSCLESDAANAAAPGLRPAIPPEVYQLDPDVGLLGRMLARLEGRTLDYSACARDTPEGKDGVCTLHWCRCHLATLPAAGRSATSRPPGSSTLDPTPAPDNPDAAGLPATGPPAAVGEDSGRDSTNRPPDPTPARAPEPGGSDRPVRVLCVEVAGNRFLRRMVRVLVSTALREATPGSAARCSGREAALLECLAAGRAGTAMPAPATGLCFAGAGYG